MLRLCLLLENKHADTESHHAGLFLTCENNLHFNIHNGTHNGKVHALSDFETGKKLSKMPLLT
jgi:hypothetical protein